MFTIGEREKGVNTSMRRMNGITEQDILRPAVEAFRKNVPEQAHVEQLPLQRDHGLELQPDGLLRIVIQGRELRYRAEIKATITKTQKLLLLMQREKLEHPLLLVTQHVNPEMAEQLRHDGMEFIDTAGNAFINQPPLYIFVKGNRRPDIAMPPPLKRAFKPAGLGMIYAFLCNPGLEDKTYRELAAATDVALGTVARIMKDLVELGFMLNMKKRGKRLMRKDELLQRWVTAFTEQLRPRLILGHYEGAHGWWKQTRFEPLRAQWGGEVAAAKLTQYLEPQVVTIYTTAQQLDQLLIENRLRQARHGNVEILKRFWLPVEPWQYEDIVHPILVYADLLATGDERNIETARMVYERHIIRLVREN